VSYQKHFEKNGAGSILPEQLQVQGNQATVRLSLPVGPQGSPGHEGLGAGTVCLSRPAETLAELKPQDGDLTPFTFRLLSAAYLGSGGYHLDFSGEGVLERAWPVFADPEEKGSVRTHPLVVVRDHSFSIEDRLGLVQNARWRPADPEHGLPHGGIEAELHINWKLGADVVRRLLHDPPLLDACSVSLSFNWEKSHPGLSDERFWGQLGEELDGEPVRVMVTDILSVEHVGLVFEGADPLARRQEDGRTEAAMSASLAAPMDGALPGSSALWRLFDVDKGDTALLERRAGEALALASLGREALESLREEVLGLIVRVDGAMESDFSRGMRPVVEAANLPTLRVLKEEYARRLERLIPVRCLSCGSTQVSRRSSEERGPAGRRPAAVDPALYR